jgi:uncharacterized membrane protein
MEGAMDAQSAPVATSAPRAVPLAHVFGWFEAAMRMFKVAPLSWCALGAITLASEVALELLPGVGAAAAKVIVPVVECGMVLGAAAIDRGAPLEMRFAMVVFGARPTALAAIVLSALLVTMVETMLAYALTGANLLANPNDERLTATALLGVVGAGTLASLPVVFVPFAVLLEGATFTRAFKGSLRGFTLNVAPLALFGALSLVLTAIGLLTFYVGLVAVFPLLTAASYAAWKDIYVPAGANLKP